MEKQVHHIVAERIAEIRDSVRKAREAEIAEHALESGASVLPKLVPALTERVWKADVDAVGLVREAIEGDPSEDVASAVGLVAAMDEAGAPREVRVGAGAKQPPARQWLVPSWLPAHRLALLTGQGGEGKSRLALQLASAVAAGDTTWLPGGPPVEEGSSRRSTVFWTAEDELDEVQRRLFEMGRASDLDALHLLDGAGSGPLWAPDGTGDLGTLTVAGRWLRLYCARRDARLVVLDSVAAVYAGNENDRSQVRHFTSHWDAWARSARCTVLLIGHPPKTQADYSGSTDWHASVRSLLTLGLEADPEAKTSKDAPAPLAPCLRSVKSNYSLGRPPALWIARTNRGPWLATDFACAARTTNKPQARGFVQPGGQDYV